MNRDFKRLYPVTHTDELAERLGISIYSAKSRATYFGLHKCAELKYYRAHEKRIVENRIDLEKFKKLFPTTHNRVLAEKFGISKSACQRLARSHGLKRDPEWIKNNCHRFKPGRTYGHQWRKGESVSPATEFKKGHKPENTLYNGAIRERFIHGKSMGLFIRIAKGRWVQYSRWLWKQHKGRIPRGFVVAIKDPAKKITIRNLKLISMKDNMLRNSGGINLPDSQVAAYIAGKNNIHLVPEILKHPELIELKRNSLKLKRLIDDKSN